MLVAVSTLVYLSGNIVYVIILPSNVGKILLRGRKQEVLLEHLLSYTYRITTQNEINW